MRTQHYDRIGVRFDASTIQELPGGARMIDGIGAHAGLYTYHDDKGQPFVELVPPETLFDPASLASADGSSITIRHPRGLVTADNYQTETHGTWVKAWDAGGDQMGVRLRLGSSDALAMVAAAMDAGDPVELSPAYEVDVSADAGNSEYGRHDGVQSGRVYNAIALLGPDEARGGPGMKLALDGPERAPAGSRIQVRAPRLDSGPGAVLPFATKRSDAMKNATITYKLDGRRAVISGKALANARDLAARVIGPGGQKLDATNSDQIAVGRVLVEIEGEEPVDLMLPVAMIEMLLEGIGAGPAAAAPAEPMPEGEAEAEVALEAADAGDEDPKLDAKIARLVDARYKLNSDARDKRDARRASVNSDAALLLPPSYTYEGVSRHQWALDAIARGGTDAVIAEARKHFDAAMADDLEAAGQLRQMLRAAAARATGDAGGLRLTTGKIEHDDAKPWASPTMPKTEVKQ